MTQDDVFARSEGNNWFARNAVALQETDWERDLPLRLLELYGVRPAKAVEVGGSVGARMAWLARAFGTIATVVEPSAEAIARGAQYYPDVRFVQGTAARTGLDEQFDLVIVNFVLHWIDRNNLLRSIAEIDGLVRDGGHLLIGDFAPSNRMRVPYHHRNDVELFTFKQDYANIFLTAGLYRSVGQLTAHHASRALASAVPAAERIAVHLLHKDLHEGYPLANQPWESSDDPGSGL